MEVVQVFSNAFPILQVTLSSMRLDNHGIFTSLVLIVLGAWVPEGKPAQDTVYGRRWAALSFHSSRPGGQLVPRVVHALRLRALESDMMTPWVPFLTWSVPTGSSWKSPTSPCFFKIVMSAWSPLLCSISSHYRAVHALQSTVLYAIFPLFLPQNFCFTAPKFYLHHKYKLFLFYS